MHKYQIGEQVRWFDMDDGGKLYDGVPITAILENGNYVLDLGSEEVEVPVTDLHWIGDESPKENKDVTEFNDNDQVQYDESIFEDSDDLLTPESLEELTRNPNDIPASNDPYQFKLVHVMIPELRDDDDWKKIRCIFAVDMAPADVATPSNGWGDARPRVDYFMEKANMTDGQRTWAQGRQRRDIASLINALGYGPALDELSQQGQKMSRPAAFFKVLKVAAENQSLVLGHVFYEPSRDGDREFMKISRWRPVEG